MEESAEEPQSIVDAANTATLNLLAQKSRDLYDKSYNRFRERCREKKAKTYSENVLLAYFDEKSKEYKSSTLWAQYSMIRSCIQVHIEYYGPC
ncbi:hypothetical protein Zmor_021407 [Zophobas morio]|uniref:Uncharacterized protein n=1 Tax=Zophobas morio TaxID=2755281 RepID=A0AA38I5K5_9CUCU|nr:hypothetical protein Zmor_021407 [Zophobas morio]